MDVIINQNNIKHKLLNKLSLPARLCFYFINQVNFQNWLLNDNMLPSKF